MALDVNRISSDRLRSMERKGHFITQRIINHFYSGSLFILALLETQSSSEEIVFDHKHHKLCPVSHRKSKLLTVSHLKLHPTWSSSPPLAPLPNLPLCIPFHNLHMKMLIGTKWRILVQKCCLAQRSRSASITSFSGSPGHAYFHAVQNQLLPF